MRYLCKWSALGICGFLAVLTILLALPGLFGIHPLLVQSGSMEPEYAVGSVIYVRQAELSRLSEGMVVTFCLPDGDHGHSPDRAGGSGAGGDLHERRRQ